MFNFMFYNWFKIANKNVSIDTHLYIRNLLNSPNNVKFWKSRLHNDHIVDLLNAHPTLPGTKILPELKNIPFTVFDPY